MIEGHTMNLHAVVSRVINKHTHGATKNMQKNFGLALCFMGEFLFALEGQVLWMLELRHCESS